GFAAQGVGKRRRYPDAQPSPLYRGAVPPAPRPRVRRFAVERGHGRAPRGVEGRLGKRPRSIPRRGASVPVPVPVVADRQPAGKTRAAARLRDVPHRREHACAAGSAGAAVAAFLPAAAHEHARAWPSLRGHREGSADQGRGASPAAGADVVSAGAGHARAGRPAEEVRQARRRVGAVLHHRHVLPRVRVRRDSSSADRDRAAAGPVVDRDQAGRHMSRPAPRLRVGSYVAIIRIQGTIIDGRSGRPPVAPPVEIPIVGDPRAGDLTVVQVARQVAADRRAAAAVVYVDSRGGSVTASEAMRQALVVVAAKKPVVVAMGPVAGSGGYWVATPGRWIVARPGTLTGSIGVLTGKLVTGGLWAKLLVNRETVAEGRHALMEGVTVVDRAPVHGLMELLFTKG